MAETQQTIDLPVPHPYAFAASVGDHGWVALAPCWWDAHDSTLHRVEQIDGPDETTMVVHCVIAEHRPAAEKTQLLRATVTAPTPLTAAQLTQLQAGLHWMLKFNEDLTPFYAHAAAQHPALWRTVQSGRGRLLRSPTLWEDVVKTICTTNITWRQTKSMVQRLVDTLGPALSEEPTRHAFPTAAQVAATPDQFFAQHVRMGYRNAYVLQLAREITDGTRDLAALTTADLPLAAMKKELRSIKGIGDYAAHTLLALLGYYGECAVDSEYRSFVTRHHLAGETRPDKELAAFYDDWGDWKYLAYWFDATQAAEHSTAD